MAEALSALVERINSSPAQQARLVGDDVIVSSVTVNSRASEPGTLFVAVQGENAHGIRFADGALVLGAVAVLTDDAGLESLAAAIEGRASAVPVIVCADPRAAAGVAAHAVYEEPSARIPVVGVTGTNGKTSVTTMLARTLQELGVNAGLMGTNGTFILHADGSEERIPTERTTPEAPEVHGLLRRMVSVGADAAALEVSSHAMVLHRVASVQFETVAFMNLSQDHLDFHASMDEYFEAKASLFTPEHARRGIVCVDDEWGARLAAQASIDTTTFSTRSESDADYVVVAVRPHGFGFEFDVRGPDGATLTLVSALPGMHYVANTIAVWLILTSLDLPHISRGEVAAALGRAGTVEGRMQLVSEADVGPRVIVDYSHTPDALEKTLVTLQTLENRERIITVMGAGGKRDALKRPLMGEVVAALSDVVIVTDDNPRGDDPAQIRAQIIEGARAARSAKPGEAAELIECGDRAEAIARAVAMAGERDIVLIAGKGAETGQDLGDRVVDFDDRVHARDALASRTRSALVANPRQDGETDA